MKNLLSVFWICVIIYSLGFITGCAEEFGNEEADFTGSYSVTGTETVTGKISQITDTIIISEDTSGNLSIKTESFGTLKAKITSTHSFRIDKQDATVKTSSGKVQVTIEGNGSVSAGLLDISGSYSVKGQVITFKGQVITFHLSGFRM